MAGLHVRLVDPDGVVVLEQASSFDLDVTRLQAAYAAEAAVRAGLPLRVEWMDPDGRVLPAGEWVESEEARRRIAEARPDG